MNDQSHDHSTAPNGSAQAEFPPEAPDPTPVRDKILWDRRDIARLTGLSVRLLEREVSAGRMPGPDVRIGRRACWRPATITTWLDSLATPRKGGRTP